MLKDKIEKIILIIQKNYKQKYQLKEWRSKLKYKISFIFEWRWNWKENVI